MSSDTALTALAAQLELELDGAVELRHQLHARPGLSGDEAATRELVLAALPGGHAATEVAGTGAVVRVGGGGPAIAVRGELDALAVHEETGVPWESRNPG